MSSLKTIDKIVLPDFISCCALPRRVSPHQMRLTVETREWLIETGVTGKKLDDLMDRFKSWLLVAMVYPSAELRVCSDIMAWLFLLDDLSDVIDNGGTRPPWKTGSRVCFPFSIMFTTLIASSNGVWKRFVLTASIGAQRRFIETMGAALQSV